MTEKDEQQVLSPNSCCDCYYNLALKGSLSSLTDFEDFDESVTVSLKDAFRMTCLIHKKPEGWYSESRYHMMKQAWSDHEVFLKSFFQTEESYVDPRSKDNGWVELRQIADKFNCMGILASVIRYEIGVDDIPIDTTPVIKAWIKTVFEFYETVNKVL